VFLAQTGFGPAVIHVPNSGQYTLTLSAPPPPIPGPNALLVLITQAQATIGGQQTYIFPESDEITINTFNAAGVPTDRFFSIAIYNIA
jgi:hypothetical protein